MRQQSKLGAAIMLGAMGWGAYPLAGDGATPGPPPVRPPLFIGESWRQPPYTGELNDPARRVTQDAVTSPNLTLTVYGPCKSSPLGIEVYGSPNDSVFPMNLWSGMCDAPVAVTLRDTSNFVDLSDISSRFRWKIRTGHLHIVHPVLKLADGTLLVGDYGSTTTAAPGQAEPQMMDFEFPVAPIKWYTLDPQKIVVTRLVEKPDLSKVDEIGWADLMPGSGHGPAGWHNMSRIEVYGKPVKR